ncbi:unnamed protein product [Pseudo-nitzschia multistriata]|uniref:Alpha-type protein kinase domain-containing protein n=1 Tax=Pseudo-nitzschia multistriata TaxID=183589 RepID=A0A448ZQS8_9STRA|nr:unnamed protein product [Pseudo-nitzschia multistriata]
MIETEHARQRREERSIDKKDLKAALKYGDELECKYGRKFRYKDLIYIVDRKKKREITCYASRLKLKKVRITSEMNLKIQAAQTKLRHKAACWKSNTVLVVDTSGSMRASDVWGARSRLDAVWICIALDFIAHRIESGSADCYDVISVVLLNDSEKAKVLIKSSATSWALYNKIVDIYNDGENVPARSHGFYVPSLKKAEEILTLNNSSSCALALCFLSDGSPSDCGTAHDSILERVESLGMRFGRRLTFYTVGMGNDPNEFRMLRQMSDTAKDYGVQSFFQLPSMSTSSLGLSLTSTATTITKTQTEMTDIATLKQRKVRDVLRESRKKAKEEVVCVVSEDEYWLYPVEKVTRSIYREWLDENRKRRHCYDIAPMMEGENTYWVAMNKKTFGEGAERFAYRFYEVGQDGKTVIGKPLVAKESRLVLEGGEASRKSFVQTFCQTQQLARRIATEFNEKMDKLYRVDKSTPKISFLDCSVYELDDNNLGKTLVLVEEKIDHDAWQKWNTNNGYVEGMDEVPEFNHEKMRSALDHLACIEVPEVRSGGAIDSDPVRLACDLDAIEEGDEDEDSQESDVGDHNYGSPLKKLAIKFSVSEVAQAFSHFSYIASGKKRLICDLQGVFDERSNTLKLTDPVVHYFNYRRQHKKRVHGRTDRGREGMAMFFDTHRDCCGHLCRLVTGGLRKSRVRSKHRQQGPKSDSPQPHEHKREHD